MARGRWKPTPNIVIRNWFQSHTRNFKRHIWQVNSYPEVRFYQPILFCTESSHKSKPPCALWYIIWQLNSYPKACGVRVRMPLPTKENLHKRKMIPDPICHLCRKAQERVEHLFTRGIWCSGARYFRGHTQVDLENPEFLCLSSARDRSSVDRGRRPRSGSRLAYAPGSWTPMPDAPWAGDKSEASIPGVCGDGRGVLSSLASRSELAWARLQRRNP